MSPSSNLTEKFEEERQRTHEQSQIVYLQGQIDELRRLIKDQTSKYQWAMEQSRKTDAAVGQVQSSFERHTEEMTQVVDRSRRDVLELRKEVAAALVKIQESFEPIRQMQTQIQQIAEMRKQDRDQSFSWVSRVEDIEERLLSLQAQVKETEERHRQLASHFDRLYEADDVALQEIRRVRDDMQIEKQSLRRQAIEAQQLATDLTGVLEEQDARISRIDEIRQHIELFAETLPEQIADVGKRFPDIEAEIKRVERISTERFLMNQERLEEMRRHADERLVTLQETEEQNTHQHTAWMGRIDSVLHELEQRLVRGVSRLEETQRELMTLIMGIGDREIQSMIAINNAVAQRLEIVKAGQAEIDRVGSRAANGQEGRG